jgi:hypothetical protein
MRWIICAIPRARRGYPRLVTFDARCQAPCIVHGGSSHSRYGEPLLDRRQADRQIGELREPKIIYGTMLLLPLCFHDGRPWKQLPRCPGLSKRFHQHSWRARRIRAPDPQTKRLGLQVDQIDKRLTRSRDVRRRPGKALTRRRFPRS